MSVARVVGHTRRVVRFIFILCLSLLLLSFLAGYPIGMYLQPKLENLLSDLFGMSVEIRGLYVRPLPGEVTAKEVIFFNQPEFEAQPHFRVAGLRGQIRYEKLLEEKVDIGRLELNNLFYFIDRIPTDEGPRNNIMTWVRHIREWNRRRNPVDDGKPSGWEVVIRDAVIRNGTFIYQDKSGQGTPKKFVFRQIEGSLKDFKWPAGNPLHLRQRVKLEGLFGEASPAPFKIEGTANFPTSKISFDLKGRVTEGDMTEYRYFLEGLPVDAVSGQYQLKIHAVCELGKIDCQNILILESPRFTARNSAAEFISGIPLKAWLGFLENQEVIRLNIPLKGDITDPKFQVPTVFGEAFREAFAQRVERGISQIKISAAKLANQADNLMLNTPSRFVKGIEQITSTVIKLDNGAKSEEKSST